MNAKETFINRAIATLTAAGAKFHVEFNGVEYGEPLEKPEPVRARRKVRANHGITNYARSLVKDMSVGDVMVVPVPEQYTKESVRTAVCNSASTAWGLSSVTTHIAASGVEVMRIK
jgi:hypothetical protein